LNEFAPWPHEPPDWDARSTTDERGDTGGHGSIDRFMGFVLVGALLWFAALVVTSVAVVALGSGSQMAHDYVIGLLQVWFVIALLGLVSLAVNVVVASVAWRLRATRMRTRVLVTGVVAITPWAYQGEYAGMASGEPGAGILGGIQAGLAFAYFAAVMAGRVHGSPG
jgi:hypothetical protein